MAWWQDREALRRYVADLLAAEFSRLRPGLPPASWTDENLRLDDAGDDITCLGADSLELVSLATALNEALHLHRTGVEDYLLMRRQLRDWLDIAAHCLENFDAEIGFRTSGSSGPPKLCVHPAARLEEEISFLARLVGPRRRVLQVVPAHHIYGFLFTVMLPGRIGASVVDSRRRIGIDAQPGDLVVGYPEFWSRLERSGRPWPEDVIGVVSTGPCPADVAAGLRAGRLSRFIEVYGSSETAGIGWRDGSRSDYTLFPHWQRQEDGILHRSSGLAASLQDRLLWHDDSHFEVLGRLDGAVQIGGINVFPGHVRDVLCRHPAIAEAAVRPMAMAGAGAGSLRLKAFIVPADPAADIAALRSGIESWMAVHLAPVERPRSLRFGPALPLTAMGKPADWPAAD